MTITVTDIDQGPFTATGAAQTVAYTFMTLTDYEIAVSYDVGDGRVAVDLADVTVSRNRAIDDSALEGGTVSFSAGAVPVGAEIYLTADPRDGRDLVWSDTGSRLKNLNEESDRIVLHLLVMQRDLARAIKVEPGQDGVAFPDPPASLSYLGRLPNGEIVYLDRALLPPEVALGSGWMDALSGAVSDLEVLVDGRVEARPIRELFGNGYDNTPLLEWAGKRGLWLGTSIPHQGAGVDGYPERVGLRLKMASVVNNAWSGSHASYAGEAAYAGLTTDAQRLSHIVALSMTEQDRLAGLALYGSGSAYNDTFNPIILASQMTADYRIKNAFATTAFDVVFLDHNHNDRAQAVGTLSPASVAVAGVAKGATTTLSLVSAAGLAVGDGLVVRINGIPKLDYCAARVLSIVGNAVTIGINSTGYAGTFVSGSAAKVDRNTLYGSFDFLLHYIRWAALDAGRALPIIILSSAPSEFTGNAYSSTIYPNARAIQAFAVARGLTMFDVASSLKVAGDQNNVLLPDGVHPTTPTTRAVFANHWVRWLTGGAAPLLNDNDYVARGQGAYRNQHEIEYSDWYAGSTTLDFVVVGGSNIITEDFVSIADWTVVGAATTITAPWNGALKALEAASVANSEPFIVRNGLTSVDAVEIAFPLYIPTLPTATAGQVKSASLFRIAGASGIWLVLNLVTTAAGTALQVGVFTQTGNAGYRVFPTTWGYLAAATVYDIKLSAVQETASRPGILLLYINGNLAFDGPIRTGDLAQANVTELVLGIQASNMGNLTVNYGPMTYGSLATPDYSTRFTGDLPLAGGGTAKVVNGKIISVV